MHPLSRSSPCLRISKSFSTCAVRFQEALEEQPKKWTPHSLRTGLIAKKRGMTSMWTDQGRNYPVTVLQLDNCQVTANITSLRRNSTMYHAVQVAASDTSSKHTTKQMLGHFRKSGVTPKKVVREFPVSPDAHVPVGTTLSAIHFVPGQFVDVVSTSIGKGFQGGMKRWGFHGLAASHGVSVSHRSSGSTGQHQDPGRVFPGKKMPGRMGGHRRTTQNLPVLRIDTTLNLIFLQGHVPGVDNAIVLISDAKKKMIFNAKHNQVKGLYEKVLPEGIVDLPFPAGTMDMVKTEGMPSVVEVKMNGRSPFLGLEQ